MYGQMQGFRWVHSSIIDKFLNRTSHLYNSLSVEILVFEMAYLTHEIILLIMLILWWEFIQKVSYAKVYKQKMRRTPAEWQKTS